MYNEREAREAMRREEYDGRYAMRGRCPGSEMPASTVREMSYTARRTVAVTR